MTTSEVTHLADLKVLTLIDNGAEHDAFDVGSCSNGCQITAEGTAEGATVREVALMGSRQRLCPLCWETLMQDMQDILAWAGRI